MLPSGARDHRPYMAISAQNRIFNQETSSTMARADIPPLDTIRDWQVLEPHVRKAARETWFDPDWLWNFCKGMQDAGLPTERTLAALHRQHQAHRLTPTKRIIRFVQLRVSKGFWDY